MPSPKRKKTSTGITTSNSKQKSTSANFERFLKSTDALFVGFGASAARHSSGFQLPLVQGLLKSLGKTTRWILDTLRRGFGVAGQNTQIAVEEALDMFGAITLVEDLAKLVEEATTPEDLAAIGALLPLVKKIIRFTFEILKVPLPVDIDRILEFMDEIATGQIDQVSPKGAEKMHRAEIRYLEAQYHLDKLVKGKSSIVIDDDVKEA